MSESEDRIQRALNDAKKKEIEERFGGIFGPGESALPPEIEADWLQDIEEFERRFEHVESTTVRHYLGNPEFTSIDRLPEEDIPGALERVMEFLEGRGVQVHAFAPVPDDELYRFVTEELLDEEIDDIHMEGLTQDFVYEMFHPNDILEVSFFAEVFLGSIFHGHPSRFKRTVIPASAVHDQDITDICARVHQSLRIAFHDIETFLSSTATVGSCRVVGDDGTATAVVEWSALRTGSMEQFCGTTDVQIDFRKDPDGRWPVVGVWLSDRSTTGIPPNPLDKRPPNCVS